MLQIHDGISIQYISRKRIKYHNGDRIIYLGNMNWIGTVVGEYTNPSGNTYYRILFDGLSHPKYKSPYEILPLDS
jgi:hypothetical protein